MQEKDAAEISRGYDTMPDLRPNEEGNVVLLRAASFGPAELWEWGLDAKGRPYERYQWCEDDFYEDSSYCKTISKEELIETLEREAAYLEQNGDPAASAEMKAISTRIKREL